GDDGRCQGVHRTARHVEGDRGDAVGVDVDLEVFHGHMLPDQTRSMTVAVPMPAPMQRVARAVDLFERSSSSSTVPRIMAPVAPSGWPMAMAPPQTLILSCGMSSACM